MIQLLQRLVINDSLLKQVREDVVSIRRVLDDIAVVFLENLPISLGEKCCNNLSKSIQNDFRYSLVHHFIATTAV